MGRKNVKATEVKAKPVAQDVPLLGTGAPATLGTYLEMCEIVFGKDSGSVDYLKEHIEKAPNGKEEVVVAAESQMILLLAKCHDMKLHLKGEGNVVPKVID